MRQCPSIEELTAFFEGASTRQREGIIRSHVVRCTRCSDWLSELDANRSMLKLHAPTTDQAPSPNTGSLTAATPSAHPEAINGFELVEEIGRGGQGVVYRATERPSGQTVAIKVMRDGPFASWCDRTRFEREMEVLRRLHHPHIVGIRESGKISGGFYYVMDFVDGVPLDQYIAERGLSVSEVLRLFAVICDAVDAAHLCGIAHRDLKPSNVHIDSAGQPHILDFGLAKAVTGRHAEPIRPFVISMTGQFTGSLAWASPEQANGSVAKVDVRTDVYSLGMMLYQMLTGCFPYGVSGTVREVLENIISAEPLDPRKKRPDVDKEVRAILLKCLTKDPASRYRSAGDLAREIRRYLRGEPIEARLSSSFYLLKKMADRHRLFTTLVTVYIVLSAFYIIFPWVRQLLSR